MIVTGRVSCEEVSMAAGSDIGQYVKRSKLGITL